MTLKDRLNELAKPKPAWRARPEVLLHPNIPGPLHGLAPRVILGEKWWNETRYAAFSSTNYHCIACTTYKYDTPLDQLEGHELYEIDYYKGRMTYIETVPLCNYCHSYIHDGRLHWLLETRQIPQSKYRKIIQHGDRVLRAVGLIRPRHTTRVRQQRTLESQGRMAPWHEWRLILFGKEYPPLYKTEEEWKEAYQRR